jgi:predicted acyltransferase
MQFFLYIVGVAMVMSQRSQNVPGKRLSLFLTTLYRAVKMFLLGINFNPFVISFSNAKIICSFTDAGVYLQGGPNISFLRIPGILQRIAFCQIVVAAIELGLPDYPTVHTFSTDYM